MKGIALAALATLANPVFAQQITGVLVNPYTGFVSAIIVVGDASVQQQHLSACGVGCEFTDFLQPSQCMIVSISRPEAVYGYNFGPADDLVNIRMQARRYCQRYGGTNCQEYPPICG